MSVNSDFIYTLFYNIKRIKIVKLREIMKLHNAIDNNFGSNISRNFHRNMKSKWMIAIMNIDIRFLIFNLSIILNNINKNIRETWIEIMLKKKLPIFWYKNRKYFIIEWKLEDREVEWYIWSISWDLHRKEKMHWDWCQRRCNKHLHFYIKNKYIIYI